MNRDRRPWSVGLLVVGLAGCVGYLFITASAAWAAVLYLTIATVGTAMSFYGAFRASPGARRVWAALATGQVLYLIGDVYWTYAEEVLGVVPYPSWGDAAYLLRYVACVVGLCWLVRGRQVGRDRAAFLDAAILTSAFGLPALIFLVAPTVSGGASSLLSDVVASAYPIGDILVLAVLLRLVQSPTARNLSFLGLVTGLGVLLATDVYYIWLTSSGGTLPPWSTAAYASTYLFIGFAAMHPSSSALATLPDKTAARPVAARIVVLGGALLLPAVLGTTLALTHSYPSPLMLAVGGGVSSLLVLVRLSDVLRESESQSAQLAVVARTDALTGVPNRRTWDHELGRASELAHSEGTTLLVAALDLDNFKNYNDTQGHLAGDLALKETASAWALVLEGHGFLARVGGDEFAVFLIGSDPLVTDALLHRLHVAVARDQTCSIGVASSVPGELVEHAMARADEALYEAKRTGRNRTVRYEADRNSAAHGVGATRAGSSHPGVQPTVVTS